MGMMDHTRTWIFETGMAPAECARTFANALGGRSHTLHGSPWRVAISGPAERRTAVATYTEMSAYGSQLTFTATAGHDGTTSCTLAMTRTTKVMLVFTADARIFRDAMCRVAASLRRDEAGLDLMKY
jgi:hypothetical protein